MYFKHSLSEKLSDEMFQTPANEYRGIPFWAWNTELNSEQLERQIGYFQEMGFGGFQMHSRTGLETEYLGKKFMDSIALGAEKANERDMISWLYDEDRWPSGSAGGLVTKDHSLRERKLFFSPQRRKQDYVEKNMALQNGESYFVTAYDIHLNEKGELLEYRQIGIDDDAVYEKWYADSSCDGGGGWFNGQTYLDILNPKAVRAFLNITYERYKEKVGSLFGKQIPAIFFDEPAFSACQRLSSSLSKQTLSIPWTGDMEQGFCERYHMDLTAKLPELFWELPGDQKSRFRYCFFDYLASRFVGSFTNQIAEWCRENGILCTGHFLGEGNFEQTVSRSGDIMRHYYNMDIPGIDTLTDGVQLVTLYQARSVANQKGGRGIVSELYGLTNWDLDFRGYKYIGDWQSAVGVTIRVPHLAHMSLKGESKRDFPPSIFYQSAWYKEYHMIEDHYARIHSALTRGQQIVRTAMIHPIETIWLNYGPQSQTSHKIWKLTDQFRDMTACLAEHQISVDYICEELLPKQCIVGSNPLHVGQMAYDTIIVPCCETLRRSTLERLTAFHEDGGRLIFVGCCPRYIDGMLSDDVMNLYKQSVHIEYDLNKLISLLDEQREVRICNADGTDTDCYISQLRQDGDIRWLFIARDTKAEFQDIPLPHAVQIWFKGRCSIKEYRTLDGSIHSCAPSYIGDNTVLSVILYQHDSLLLRLDDEPSVVEKSSEDSIAVLEKTIDFKHPVPFTLSEPNVLLLDRPEYAYDDGEWQPEEDVLRITRAFKETLKFSTDSTQPWALPPEKKENTLHLRYTIYSDIAYSGARLGVELCEGMKVGLNGQTVDVVPEGYYIDECIQTISLPPLNKGENYLTLDIPFSRRTFAECIYLLGNFGVRLAGAQATIIAMPNRLGFSDITAQGLPFYSGKIIYHTEFETTENTDLVIRACQYRGAYLKVSVDGRDAGQLTFSPYRLQLDELCAGKHTVDFHFCATRYNTLAALHQADARSRFADPSSWRTLGDAWTYNYRVKPAGILTSPVLELYAPKNKG